MATLSPSPSAPPRDRTVADLLARLGGVPPDRVLLVPAPGTATEKDVVDMDDRADRLCELIDGVLDRKLRDYFAAGVRLVWYIDPKKRTAGSYNAVDACDSIAEDGGLNGGDVLPGFELSLIDLFAEAEGAGE